MTGSNQTVGRQYQLPGSQPQLGPSLVSLDSRSERLFEFYILLKKTARSHGLDSPLLVRLAEDLQRELNSATPMTPDEKYIFQAISCLAVKKYDDACAMAEKAPSHLLSKALLGLAYFLNDSISQPSDIQRVELGLDKLLSFLSTVYSKKVSDLVDQMGSALEEWILSFSIAQRCKFLKMIFLARFHLSSVDGHFFNQALYTANRLFWLSCALPANNSLRREAKKCLDDAELAVIAYHERMGDDNVYADLAKACRQQLVDGNKDPAICQFIKDRFLRYCAANLRVKQNSDLHWREAINECWSEGRFFPDRENAVQLFEDALLVAFERQDDQGLLWFFEGFLPKLPSQDQLRLLSSITPFFAANSLMLREPNLVHASFFVINQLLARNDSAAALGAREFLFYFIEHVFSSLSPSEEVPFSLAHEEAIRSLKASLLNPLQLPHAPSYAKSVLAKLSSLCHRFRAQESLVAVYFEYLNALYGSNLALPPPQRKMELDWFFQHVDFGCDRVEGIDFFVKLAEDSLKDHEMKTVVGAVHRLIDLMRDPDAYNGHLATFKLAQLMRIFAAQRVSKDKVASETIKAVYLNFYRSFIKTVNEEKNPIVRLRASILIAGLYFQFKNHLDLKKILPEGFGHFSVLGKESKFFEKICQQIRCNRDRDPLLYFTHSTSSAPCDDAVGSASSAKPAFFPHPPNLALNGLAALPNLVGGIYPPLSPSQPASHSSEGGRQPGLTPERRDSSDSGDRVSPHPYRPGRFIRMTVWGFSSGAMPPGAPPEAPVFSPIVPSINGSRGSQ